MGRILWLGTALVAFAILALLAFVVVPALRSGPPASARFAGVAVSLAGRPAVSELAGGGHELSLSIVVTSTRPVPDCLAFALDNPFRGRVFRTIDAPGGCLHPVSGTAQADIRFDGLTDDDLVFASHALVWGGDGGRCGPILGGLFGLCAIDGVGRVPVTLPVRSVLPSFGPIGSLVPLFSFAP